MKNWMQVCVLLALMVPLSAGTKKKSKQAEAPPAEEAVESAAPEPAPEPEPEPAPEPEPEPAAVSNADFNASVIRADGSASEGHVMRVERSEDWYAEDGWTDREMKLTVTVEGNGTEREVPWSEIQSVDISFGGKGDIDCTYDSDYTPLMWMCTLKTTGKVTLADGSTWTAAGRHKWKFTFDDGSEAEFWIYKLPERQQEDPAKTQSLNETVNADLQIDLQSRVMELARTGAAKSIRITAP